MKSESLQPHIRTRVYFFVDLLNLFKYMFMKKIIINTGHVNNT